MRACTAREQALTYVLPMRTFQDRLHITDFPMFWMYLLGQQHSKLIHSVS